MSVSDSQIETLVKLVDEYLARRRRGEQTSVGEYVHKFPNLADGIRELFPLSAMMDDLSSPDEQPSKDGRDGEASVDNLQGVPPKSLGEYRIIRQVGRGGMGIVYQAEHARLSRHVAIKVLHPAGPITPGQRERFEREARAAARLHHTNIVPVFDVGEDGGAVFYTMQLIRGQGLDKWLDETRESSGPERFSAESGSFRACADSRPKRQDSPLVPWEKLGWSGIARIGIQIADALQYAHSHGTLHRDIKPSNLLLDTRGVVWIADFGLARLEHETSMTQRGEFVGTLRYMAPERFDGLCDQRSDIYSLGLTLYELATLSPAFPASSRHRLIQQVTQQEPHPPRKLNPAIPRDLETILLKAIAREPGRRYQTAGDLQADLTRFVEGKPISARRSSAIARAAKWVRRKPVVAGLLATVVLSVLAGLAGVSWHWRQAEQARDAAVRLADMQTRTLAEKTQALEEAGRANREARFQLARHYEANGFRQLDRDEWHVAALWLSEALAIDTQLQSAGFSGLNHEVAMGRRRLANLWRASPRLMQLKSLPGYRCHCLTEDAAICIADDGRKCHVWRAETGQDLYPPISGRLASPNAVSSDGKRLLLFDSDGVRIHDLHSGKWQKSFKYAGVMLATWACGGERIAALNLEGNFRLWDTTTGRRVGGDRELGVPPAVYRSLYAFAVSKGGQRLAIVVEGKRIPVYNLRTGNLVSEFTTPTQALGVALDAAGQHVVVQDRDVRVWKVASKQQAPVFQTQINTGLGRITAFSPDGKRIAIGDREGVVRVRDLASGDFVLPPLQHESAVHSVAFSPDGNRLVTASHDATVCLWDASSGLRIGPVLRHEDAAVADFSSDGRQIVTATRKGVIRIWDLSSIKDHETLLGQTARVTIARYSPDGRYLVTGDSGGTLRVYDGNSVCETVSPMETGERVQSISFNEDRCLVLTQSSQARVRLWTVNLDGPELEQKPLEFSDIRLAKVGPSGNRILLARDRRYGIFDFGNPAAQVQFDFLGSKWDRAIGVDFDVARERVLVYSNYGSVHVVHAPSRKILLKRPPKPDHRYPDVVWAGFGSGGDEILVALTDGTIERWRISTALSAETFSVNGEPVHAAVNRRGDRLIVAGRDNTIRVWDVPAGRPQTPLIRQSGRIACVAFSPEGDSFATCCRNGFARIWDPETGQPLTPALRHGDSVSWAEFHPNGRWVVTGGDDKFVRMWPISGPDSRPVRELLELARLYSARQIQPGAGTISLSGSELERLFHRLR